MIKSSLFLAAVLAASTGICRAATYTTEPPITSSIRDEDDVIINSETTYIAVGLDGGKEAVPVSAEIVSTGGDVIINMNAPGRVSSYNAFMAGNNGTLTIKAGPGKSVIINDNTEYTDNHNETTAFMASAANDEGSDIIVNSKVLVNNTYRGVLAGGNSRVTFNDAVTIQARRHGVQLTQLNSGQNTIANGAIYLNSAADITAGSWCVYGMYSGVLHINSDFKARSAEGLLISAYRGARIIANGGGVYDMSGELYSQEAGSLIDITMTQNSRWDGWSSTSTGGVINLLLTDVSSWQVTEYSMLSSLIVNGSAGMQLDIGSDGNQVVVEVSDTLSLDDGTLITLGLNDSQIDKTLEMQLFEYTGDPSAYRNGGFTLVTKDGVTLEYEEGSRIGWYRFFANSIPEPGSCLLSLLAIAPLVGRRTRRTR